MDPQCPFCNIHLIPQQRVVLSSELCLFLRIAPGGAGGSGVIVPKATGKPSLI